MAKPTGTCQKGLAATVSLLSLTGSMSSWSKAPWVVSLPTKTPSTLSGPCGDPGKPPPPQLQARRAPCQFPNHLLEPRQAAGHGARQRQPARHHHASPSGQSLRTGSGKGADPAVRCRAASSARAQPSSPAGLPQARAAGLVRALGGCARRRHAAPAKMGTGAPFPERTAARRPRARGRSLPRVSAPFARAPVLWRFGAARSQVSNPAPHPDRACSHGNCTCKRQTEDLG